MEIKIEILQKFINENFRGNISWFSEEIGVDNTYVSTIMNNNKKTNSNKIILGIIKYCELHNKNFRDYIFLQ